MDTITREEADQRVAEGLTMLADADVSSSGISKRTLDIGDHAQCIGGQLAQGKTPVNLYTDVLDCDASKGVDGGFDLAFAERSDENYAELTAAWKRVL
jgi:hypothetical protein